MPVESQVERHRAATKVPERLWTPIAVVALQSVAAIWFIIDGVEELIIGFANGPSFGNIMEVVVAVALITGIVIGSRELRLLTNESEKQGRALATARGEIAEHIAHYFAEWGLSAGEREVALFALKGCDVAEIARLRSAAPGTVRSQLSQIYAKAGVTSQAMLVSLFIEDLLEGAESILGSAPSVQAH